ncbi:hypothetical protein [Dongia sp.]|uniref:hypothetical protein n=1 Tax=Dongia sp. TaxID=1977262 RepID=UPI0035B4F843
MDQNDIKKQVDALKTRIEAHAYEAEKAEAGRWQTRTAQDITGLARFFAQVAVGALWLYEHLLAPAGRFLSVPMLVLFNAYRRLWARVVYSEDKFQVRRFSKTRAGLMLAISLICAWFVVLPLLGLLWDTGLYLATARRDEVVYLTNSQEIAPEHNIHSVQGCHSLPCTDDNSFYFRIRATLFNEIWSLAHGHGFFFPDYVAAAVPLSISECKITSYGLRIKLMMRGLDFYPDVLETTCTPLGGNGADGGQ